MILTRRFGALAARPDFTTEDQIVQLGDLAVREGDVTATQEHASEENTSEETAA